MVKLLMRFYDVNSGAILVDGHNVKEFNRSELREIFGMVLQDTWLFKGTIMEISGMDGWMPRTKRLLRRPRRPMHTGLSRRFPAAIRWS